LGSPDQRQLRAFDQALVVRPSRPECSKTVKIINAVGGAYCSA
jgi:hypothetical protein